MAQTGEATIFLLEPDDRALTSGHQRLQDERCEQA
jgi:hypothetical protein